MMTRCLVSGPRRTSAVDPNLEGCAGSGTRTLLPGWHLTRLDVCSLLLTLSEAGDPRGDDKVGPKHAET